MAAQTIPRDLIRQLIRQISRRGVAYADVRFERILHESLVIEHQQPAAVSASETAGVGIRVLIGGSWGFAATPRVDLANLKRAAETA